MPETEVFPKRVKAIRKAMELSQEEFVAEIGICTEELSLIERAKTDVKLSTMTKIATFTGLSVSQLLPLYLFSYTILFWCS